MLSSKIFFVLTLICLQALPQVTIVVGCINTSEHTISIVTTAELADEPKHVDFPCPTLSNPLIPGKPNWANYVKGVVQCFKSMILVLNAFF